MMYDTSVNVISVISECHEKLHFHYSLLLLRILETQRIKAKKERPPPPPELLSLFILL